MRTTRGSSLLALHAGLGLGLAWVAHELGFGAVADESVDHSHMGMLAPWVGVAVAVSLLRSSAPLRRLDWRRVIALQAAVLVVLEIAERLVQSLPLTSAVAPAIVAVVAGTLLGLTAGSVSGVRPGVALLVRRPRWGGPPPGPSSIPRPSTPTATSPRAPPVPV